MRLICTNCDAQYEVDDSVIPDGGRDVQCSNCGHAWFQPGRFAAAAEEDAELAAEEPLDVEALAGAPAEPDAYVEDDAEGAPPSPAGGAEAAGGPGADAGDGVTDESLVPPVAPSRQLDDDMLAVLREEAERETMARRAEGTADLEYQPDLGLADAASPPRPAAPDAGVAQTADEMAGGYGGEQVAEFGDPGEDSPRGKGRTLLPDIETINSTLRASSAPAGDNGEPETVESRARERGGFRLGFSISLIVAVLLLALYVLAPPLARQVPALSPALTAYVGAINEARMWIDDFMRSSTEAMKGS